MKIKDTEYLYATTRIRSLEKTLLNRERLERLLDAKSLEDMVKILAELGYQDISSPTMSEVERAIAKSREDIFELVYSLSPDPNLIDVFSIKYDYHNVKAILKGEAVNIDPGRLLINAGRISAVSLQSHMRQMDYRDFPAAMRSAIEESRELLNRTGDPQLTDFVLDRAYFSELRDASQKSNSAFLQGYVRLLIDITNLRSLVRALRQNKDTEFLRGALIPGGNVDASRFISATTAESTIKDLFVGTPLESSAEAGSRAISGEAGFTLFERLCDDAIMKYLQSARYVAFGEAPLVAFLAAKEADITAIRIIMAGKLQDLPVEEIRERLRLSYV